jgi:ankyrin repeat protein
MILHGHALAQTPWPEGEFGQIKTEIRYWTWKHEHKALFQVLLVFGGLLDGRTPSKLMADLAREGKTCLLQALFEQHGSAADLADIFLAAVDGKQLSALDLLLSFGADVNARVQVEGTHTFGQGNPVEVTPLHLAASNGDEEIIKRLISAGADVNALIRGVGINAMPIFSTALDMACKGGWYSIIFLLLSKGANPRLPYDSTNGSALTAASYFGSTVIVRKLLLAGANINARQHNGTYGTALIAATSEGRLAVIQELLNAGANVNTQAYFCPHTALIAAAMRGRADVVNYLLDVGAHVNAQAPGTAAFGTALIAAVHSGVMQVVDSLLAAGADVNAQVPGTVRDGTALITATSRQNKDMVLRLLAAGADTNAVVKLGEHKTALGVAAHLTNSGILDHLLGAGADAQLAYDKLSPRKNLQVADQEARRRLRQAFRF